MFKAGPSGTNYQTIFDASYMLYELREGDVYMDMPWGGSRQ